MATLPLPTRADLDPAETWALQHLYEDDAAYEGALTAIDAGVQGLVGFRGRLGDDAATLARALEALSDLTAAAGRARSYAFLPTAVDGTDAEARRRAGRFAARAAGWESATAFLRPELLAIDPGRLAGFRREEARLGRFAPYFGRLEREREHVRSAEVEDVLALAGAPFRSVGEARHALTTSDMRFEPAEVAGEELEVAPSTVRALEASPRREVRRGAYVSFADGHLQLQETLAQLLGGRSRQLAFEARVRGYGSSEGAALDGMYVPPTVLDATLAAFEERLGVWHRYWGVRRALLGVDRLEAWDVHAPLVDEPPVVPIAQATEWIVESARPLGRSYAERIRDGLVRERWVDLRPNRGKREGAFCDAAPGVHPFIMMSYVDDLPSASTLAHELGHAMHAELALAAQDPLDAQEPLSMTVAETASNGQQALLRAFLLRGPAADDPRLELAVLDEALRNFHRYFFVMPTLVRFERWLHGSVHAGEAPDGAQMTERMRALFGEGYGDAIDAGPREGITWAQFPHLYVPFYTFQYAVGIAAAAALVGRIDAGEEGAAAAMVRFMEAGGAVPPVELFGSVGLDVTTPDPVHRAFDVLEGYVARLEAFVR